MCIRDSVCNVKAGSIVIKLQDVEEIPADRLGRTPGHCHIKTCNCREGFRQQGALNLLSVRKLHVQVLADAAAFGIDVDLFTTRAPKFNLSLHCLYQATIVPGLLDEVVNASLHRLDGELNRSPARQNDDRQGAIQLSNLCYEVEPFLT